MNSHRIVFDCMVFVQLIASRGPAFQCYERVTSEGDQLVVSTETLAELAEVLHRPDLRKRLPGITPERADALLHHLRGLALVMTDVQPRFRFPPDPKDEPYLNLAIESQAHYLVTRDKAILGLCEPLNPLRHQFSKLNPWVLILKPETFLVR